MFVTLKLQGACWFLMKKNINNETKSKSSNYSIIKAFQLLGINIYQVFDKHYLESLIFISYENKYTNCLKKLINMPGDDVLYKQNHSNSAN